MRKRFDERNDLIHPDAKLALLLRYIDFYKNIRGQPSFCRFLFNRLGKPKRIHRVDQFRFLYDILYFVGLQMPDHMPVDIRGQGAKLLCQLLNLILPKHPDAQIIGFPKDFHRLRLADRDQGHFLPFPSRPRAGSLYSRLYFMQLIPYHHSNSPFWYAYWNTTSESSTMLPSRTMWS